MLIRQVISMPAPPRVQRDGARILNVIGRSDADLKLYFQLLADAMNQRGCDVAALFAASDLEDLSKREVILNRAHTYKLLAIANADQLFDLAVVVRILPYALPRASTIALLSQEPIQATQLPRRLHETVRIEELILEPTAFLL